jgi:hypothetical protein
MIRPQAINAGKRRRRGDELQAALLRARALWEDLFRLMRAKDRALLRDVDTSDLERLMELRGVELSREEALISRLDGDDEAVLEPSDDWRAAWRAVLTHTAALETAR